MKKLLILLAVLFSYQSYAQIEYVEVDSKILNGTRQIKVQLPRNYEKNEDKSYPVIVVFDGDYLFEPVAGLVDYFSYWEYIPEAIVIGVNQVGFRNDDGLIDSDVQYPIDSGAQFYDFINLEVMKFVDENYRTSPFVVITAQDYMANFASFFLMKDNPLFRGYVNISPDYTSKTTDRLKEVFSSTKQKTWYYISTAEDDIKELRKTIRASNATFQAIDNNNFYYYYDDFKDQDHFTQVGFALSSAFQKIFSLYKPISEDEYLTKVLKADDFVEYLIEKYDDIAELYALDIKMRTSDFFYINDAIEKNEKWEQFKDLSDLAEDQLPETLFSSYFLGRYYEEIGKPKKAMRSYNSGYGLEEVGFITNDLVIQKAEKIKEIFGY